MKLNRLKIKLREYTSVLKTEYNHIFRDAGVMLILIFALIIYATLYSLAYKNQVLRNIPVAVVDRSNTPSSRHLVRTFNSGPNIDVQYNAADMEEAEELFYGRKIYGIIYIPEDYERNLLKNVPATVGVYVDASYFLMYRQVFSDVVAGISGTSTEIEFSRLLAKGINPPQAEAISHPVFYKQTNLFNPYLGYGTFIMPAILIAIIQQTTLIGIGMIGGTWREFGLYKKLITPGEKRLSTVPIVLGKATAYLSLYAVTITYIFGIHYRVFGYPMNGSFGDIFLFMIPYLLSCIFLGITISTLFRRRENSILFLLWTSIPIVLLSGMSLPKEAIPGWMYAIGQVFPTSSGIPGFIRLQTMGANLSEVGPEYTTLWILTGVFLLTACLSVRVLLNRQDVK